MNFEMNTKKVALDNLNNNETMQVCIFIKCIWHFWYTYEHVITFFSKTSKKRNLISLLE